MSIWFKPYTLEDLQAWIPDTMLEHLNICFTAIGSDSLSGVMPVDKRTWQSMRILHGGASMALAETLGSVAGNMCVDTTRLACVGQEINGNHLRPVRSGEVTGVARPIHLGQRSQVWQIEIRNPQGELSCISRLTMAVVKREPDARFAMPTTGST